MQNADIVLAVISTVLGSGILNGIVAHFLYKNKLKKELKSKGHEMIAKDIGRSLQFVRDMELRLTVQEIFDAENEFEERGSQVNLFGGECIYPEIFNNWEHFNKFKKIVNQCRSEHEKNLSVKVALNLVFIDRYISQLGLFMAENGGEAALPFWGTIFIFDLQKWQKKMDKLLVKEINKYGYKLESHETRKWTILRKQELTKQYEDTILSYLLTGTCRKRNKKKMEYIKDAIETVFLTENEK